MSDRFERCGTHGVRNCLVCHPVVSKVAGKMVAVATQIPGVPNFPAASEVPVESPIADIQSKSPIADIPPNILMVSTPDSHEEKVMAAAERYTKACSAHMQTQRDVARLKEQLESTKQGEVKAHEERVASQKALAELVGSPA